MLEHVSVLCTAVVRLWSHLPYCTHPSLHRHLILPPGAVVDDEAAALKHHFIWMHTFPCSTVLPVLQMKRWGTEIVSHSSKVTWLVNARGLNSVLPSTCSSPSLPSSLLQGRQQLPPSLVSQKPPRRTPTGKVSVVAEDELSPNVGSAWSLNTIAKEGWSPLGAWRNLCGAFKAHGASALLRMGFGSRLSNSRPPSASGVQMVLEGPSWDLDLPHPISSLAPPQTLHSASRALPHPEGPPGSPSQFIPGSAPPRLPCNSHWGSWWGSWAG